MTPAAPPTTFIPANEYRRVRWKNGAGWTREICALRHDGRDGLDAADWDWRLSIAEIEADAPFSIFPGVHRELVLLSGNGLRLRFDDGDVQVLHPPHERHRFAGDRALVGELIDGRTEDFNLMWRSQAVEAELWHRPLVGPMVVFVDAGETWALHLLVGSASIVEGLSTIALSRGDTVLLHADGLRARHVVSGGGEALLVKVRPRVLPDGSAAP